MNIQELRVGNIIGINLQTFPNNLFSVLEIGEFAMKLSTNIDYQKKHDNVCFFDNELLEGFKPDKTLLKNLGFKSHEHFTIGDVIYIDLDRNRQLSMSCLGTPNEFLSLCEVDYNKKLITNVVVLHNYDYDGPLFLHKIQNIYHSITSKELTFIN